MKLKIKTNNSCVGCRMARAKHRKEDIAQTKIINRKIRNGNKNICQKAKLSDDIENFSDEIDEGDFQGYYWD